MSDTASTKPIDDAISNTSSTLAARIENIKSALSQYPILCDNSTSARVRYMTILIENDQVENISVTEMVDECIEMLISHRGKTEYIKLVVEYTFEQIHAKKYGMPERAKEIKEIIRFAERMVLFGRDIAAIDDEAVIRSPFYERLAIDSILRLDPHLRPRRGPLSGLRYR